MALDNLSNLAKRLRQLVERKTREKAVLIVDILNLQWEQIRF